MNSELGKCGRCKEYMAVESIRGLPVCNTCAKALMGNQAEPVKEQAAPEDDKSQEDFEKNGKEAINLLLWRFLPPNITLGRADEIACKIFDLINHPEGP